MNKPEEDKTPAFVLGAALAPFWWDVMIPVPADNGYTYAKLPVQYQPVDQEELDVMRGTKPPPEGQSMPTDHDVVRRVVRNARVLTPEGAVVPFTEEVLPALLRAPMVRTAIVTTFLAVMAGAGARKNG
jgi:hypothetical protein